VGGVGISYAIQDAIEAANVLTAALLEGKVTESQLARVQTLREPAVKTIQKFQGFVQERVVKSALTPNRPFQLPWIARFLLALPILRNIPARMIAFGTNPARIQNP
jgi:2-polyprenyl-6-methoxyphenol hydroxylase-like FAD-dependent oxidoreductase